MSDILLVHSNKTFLVISGFYHENVMRYFNKVSIAAFPSKQTPFLQRETLHIICICFIFLSASFYGECRKFLMRFIGFLGVKHQSHFWHRFIPHFRRYCVVSGSMYCDKASIRTEKLLFASNATLLKLFSDYCRLLPSALSTETTFVRLTFQTEPFQKINICLQNKAQFNLNFI